MCFGVRPYSINFCTTAYVVYSQTDRKALLHLLSAMKASNQLVFDIGKLLDQRFYQIHAPFPANPQVHLFCSSFPLSTKS